MTTGTTDLVRLADVATRIAAGERCPDARAAALMRWIGLLADDIECHHRAEDDVAWPVIARYAGRSALDLQLAAVRAGAATVADVRGDNRRRAAGFLASALATLRDHLAEHAAAEETGPATAPAARRGITTLLGSRRRRRERLVLNAP